jgi:hypothetical protein
MAGVAPPPSVPELGDLAARREVALARADDQIDWYERHSRRQWQAFSTFQTAAVVLGALTPVLILWSSVPKALQALPAALAAIATGLVGIFRWPQNKTRYSFTAEALKSERVKYATRTGSLYGSERSDDEALNNFVARIEDIAMTEVAEWRGEFARASGEPSADGATPRRQAPGEG